MADRPDGDGSVNEGGYSWCGDWVSVNDKADFGFSQARRRECGRSVEARWYRVGVGLLG